MGHCETPPTVGVLPLGRTTFNIKITKSKLTRIMAPLDEGRCKTDGSQTLLCDKDAVN